jgi:hypothetical protein
VTPSIRLAYHPQGGPALIGPSVRLAYNPGPINAYGALAPTVRLATTIDGGGAMGPKAFERHLGNPVDAPGLLVSYVYLEPFLRNRENYHYRDWVMDSGAFSAHKTGTVIDIEKYIDQCQGLMESDPTLTEVFSLDVIGDWRASEKNTELMWKRGIPAVPTYHVGEPVGVLTAMASAYPKIALGGAVGYRHKDAWAKQCFAKIWPKKIHGLGFGAERSIMLLPWHSVDATNWEIGPCKFGRWQSFGKMSVRGSKQDLRGEVLAYLEIERKARNRWRKEMAVLESQPENPVVRLSLDALRVTRRRLERDDLTVRLAVQPGSGRLLKDGQR